MKHIIFFALIILSSCTNNNCDDPIVDINHVLSDEAKSYLSIYENKSRVKYLDSNGDTISFEIRNYLNEEEDYEMGVPCEEDRSETQIQTGKKQFMEVEIYNQLLEKPFVLNMSQTLNSEREEMLVISKGNYRLNLEESDLLRGVDIPIENSQNSTIDSLEINGKIFYDFVEGSNELNTLLIRYNKDFGLFYIKYELLNLELLLTEIE